MAEVIGIASGLLAIIEATSKSALSLYQAIKSYKDQPKEIRGLQTRLNSLQGVLSSIGVILSDSARNNPSGRLEPIRVPLFSCYECCEELRDSFQATFKHSLDGSRSLRDWTRAQFREKSFSQIQDRLEVLKAALLIAVETVQLQEEKATQEALDSLEELVKDTKTDLSNALGDIKDAMSSKNDAAKLSLDEDRQLLQQCLKLCAAAEKLAKDRSNIVAENVTADFGAIQTLGGDRGDTVVNMTFKDISAGISSRQAIGNFSPESLKAHLNARVPPADILLEYQRARPQPQESETMQFLLRQRALSPPEATAPGSSGTAVLQSDDERVKNNAH